MTLQEQAWASVSPANVLAELQSKHKIKVDGDKLLVMPAPSPRLTFQIRRYKQKLLELMGIGKTLAQRITEAQQQLGWKVTTDDDYSQEERLSIVTENSHKGKAITFDPAELETMVQPPWPTPEIERDKSLCPHPVPGYYRVKVDGQAVVKYLCPECGHNLKGPRRGTPPAKRSTVPWWPKDSQITPDPDAATDELVEWWNNTEASITDGCTFSPGVTVGNARQFKASINEQIGLWRLGGAVTGFIAQLTAHRAYTRQQEAGK